MPELSFRQQFQWRCFGFYGFSPSDFLNSRWAFSKTTFTVYRTIVFLYWTTCMVVEFSLKPSKWKFCQYLSHWNQAQLTLFLGFSLFSVIIKSPKEKPAVLASKNSEDECFIVVHNSDSIATESNTENDTRLLKWYHVLISMLFVSSLSISFAVTVMYVTMEWKDNNGTLNASFLNLNLHFLNSVLILLDFFVNRIPIRLLHFVYVSIFTTTYCLFLFVLHVTNQNSSLYKIVDWENNPRWAIIFSVGMVFLIAPAAHCLLYLFRYLFIKFCKVDKIKKLCSS